MLISYPKQFLKKGGRQVLGIFLSNQGCAWVNTNSRRTQHFYFSKIAHVVKTI